METIGLQRKAFQTIINGKQTDLFVLQNKNNLNAYITNYGARWVSMPIVDKNKNIVDVITGFDSLQGYINSSNPYYGAMIGRYANRIAYGRFKLKNKQYQLTINDGVNHLHGGFKGFHVVVWDILNVAENSVTLKYNAADGEEGYPGKMELILSYTLSNADEMIIDFTASTGSITIVNITNHAFFNLNGQGSSSIADHLLTINASYYTPVDEALIPYGNNKSVEATPFDFRKPVTIGKRINQEDIQLKHGNGYDHNFVLNKEENTLSFAARAKGNISGIQLELYTTEPGMQFYSGNFMKGDNKIRNGFYDKYRNAFCLETQHFPDSPNQPFFPGVELHRHKNYHSTTIFKFLTINGS